MKKLNRVVNKIKGKSEPQSPEFIFHLDNPGKSFASKHKITVSGWVMPLGETNIKRLRLKNNSTVWDLPYGLKRLDVAQEFPQVEKNKAEHCGFSKEINFKDGQLEIEVDLGEDFKTVHRQSLQFSKEPLYETLFNPDLAVNFAEHQNLLNNKKDYYFEERLTNSYERYPNDPRLIAFYLPQFHPIPENDKAWGKGFTEWRNVTTATAKFIGHQQPILPKDLGFYDLRLDTVMQEQIELAKRYGFFGFCFYYYWFSGKKLLDKPLQNFLKHREWDFNFLICWANENWTKKWDGREDDVIVAQKYTEQDPLDFIKDIEDILLDPRYIRHEGKPVLMVYRAEDLKNPEAYVKEWRRYFKKQHGVDLYLVSAMGFNVEDPRKHGFDAGLDFAPQTNFFKTKIFKDNKFPMVDAKGKKLDLDFNGTIADYRALALNKKLYRAFDFPTFKSVTPHWDNTARRGQNGFVFYNNSPELYATWLDEALQTEADDKASPLVFINAWNEWAEGATLEPSLHYGHAVLNRTVETLSLYSGNQNNKTNFPLYGIKRTADLAVVVHAYYPEKWENIIEKKLAALDKITYDLFVTINIKDENLITEITKKHKNAKVYVVPNRGRDILPFLILASRLQKAGYKYVLKMHTKKSNHRSDGDDWLKEMAGNLLSKTTVPKILKALEKDAALVGPSGHYVSLERYMGSDENNLKILLTEIYGAGKTGKILNAKAEYGYFAGSMLWLKLDSIKQLLDLNLLPEDFESEKGQIDGTLAHAVERLLTLLPEVNGGKIYRSDGVDIKLVTLNTGTTEYRYAP